MRMTSGASATSEPPARGGGARRRAPRRVRLGGRQPDDDGVSGFQFSRNDLRESPVRDSGPDLDRLGIPFEAGMLVDGRRARAAFASPGTAATRTAGSGGSSARSPSTG